jgi:TolA-binding protein
MSKKGRDRKKTHPSAYQKRKKHDRIYETIIFFFSFLLYVNTVGHGYVLDDDVVYLKNSLVQKGIAGIKDIFTHSFIYGFTGFNDQSYRPLVQVIFAFEKSLFGNNPHVQHFINALLFAVCSWLVFCLAHRMFYFVQPVEVVSLKVPFAFFIALLFAAHPIHTESVANIKGRDEIVHFIFIVLSLLFAFRYATEKNKKHLWISAFLFFCALLSKEMAVTFLLLIPLTVFLFAPLSFKNVVFMSLPFLGMFVLYFVIRKSVLDVVTFQEKMKVVNNALAAATTHGDRIATALFILGIYVKLLFFPYPLSWDYSYNQIPITSFSDWKTISITLLFLAVMVFSLFVLWKRIKQETVEKIPVHIVFSFCVLFFFISMSVVSNIFILIGATLGERFLFTPSLAFCVAVPFFANRLGKTFLLVITGIFTVFFSYLTVERNKDWASNFTLFESGVKAAPNSSRVQSAMGSAYREIAEKEQDLTKRKELFQKALSHYLRATKILPENTEALYNAGVTYYNLGNKEEALRMYLQTLSISPEQVNAANNAGVIYFERGEYETARKYFEHVLRYQSNNSDALGNIGAIHHNRGNYEEAIKYYNRALAANPMNQNVRANLEKIKNSSFKNSKQKD